jgi:hypothetical protein
MQGKRKKALLDGIRELDVIAEGRALIEEERVKQMIFLGSWKGCFFVNK